MNNQKDEAIYFWNKPYKASKYFSTDSNKDNAHFYSEEKTFSLIQSTLKKAGVKRLANITGFDRVGIPVFNAIRPNMEGYAVQHGKGLNSAAAKVSACMESIERYYAVNSNVPYFQMSYNELIKKYISIPLDRLAFSKNSVFNSDFPEKWCLGWDIINQEEVAVPYNLVLLKKVDGKRDLESFQTSSNGLAAGINFLETVCQAIFEVIERDAITCHKKMSEASGTGFPLKQIDLNTIEYREVKELLLHIEDANILPLIFDCEVDTNVPTYNCYLIDKMNQYDGVCHGMGTSLNPAIAMTRAITEAIQARAVFYSGIRDVFFHDNHFAQNMYDNNKYIDLFRNKKADVDASLRESESSDTFEADIHICIEKLREVGITQIIVCELSGPGDDACVVKVIIPGLEGYILPIYRPGKRALNYFKGRMI
jgi:YcaO-like protein with predicted kinase domain